MWIYVSMILCGKKANKDNFNPTNFYLLVFIFNLAGFFCSPKFDRNSFLNLLLFMSYCMHKFGLIIEQLNGSSTNKFTKKL